MRERGALGSGDEIGINNLELLIGKMKGRIGEHMILSLESIRLDGGTQSRAQLDWVAIDEYAGAMIDGAMFPPIIVFYDGADYWLADGFHRVRSAEKANIVELAADVRQGTRRDAILYSVSANSSHGVRRSNRDKRQAVEMLLRDDEWVGWSDVKIADQCGVSNMFVGNLRKTIIKPFNDTPAERKVTRNGVTYTQDTTNIGKVAPIQEPVPQMTLAEATEPDPIVYPEPQEILQPAPKEQPVYVVDIADVPPVTVLNRDARFIADYLPAGFVHLIVTSPPYNVGIDYDNHSDDLSTYTELITDVWRECYSVLADGGRLCVNVPFGVGRNPWIPMASRVIDTILAAGFILRGQIVWDKGTAGGKTSWGSFRLPTNPGLRDTTECIIVAHKGQGSLEIPSEHRLTDAKGTYTAWLADSEYFMDLTNDHWLISPESARRVKHPAPFPTELVRRLVHFYGFPGCHIVDPFGGSGTVGIVAKELGCQATLFEISADYCRLAEERIANA